MDKSYLECKFCCKEFDGHFRVPRMIYTCGHSICLACLKSFMQTSDHFICVEDHQRIFLSGQTVEKFPPNAVLLKILGDYSSHQNPPSLGGMQMNPSKKLSLGAEVRPVDSNSNKFMQRLLETEMNSISIQNRQNSNSDPRDQSDEGGSNFFSEKKFSETRRTESPLSSNSNSVKLSTEDMCKAHGKPLEAVCTKRECRVRVCLACGVFGDHIVN